MAKSDEANTRLDNSINDRISIRIYTNIRHRPITHLLLLPISISNQYAAPISPRCPGPISNASAPHQASTRVARPLPRLRIDAPAPEIPASQHTTRILARLPSRFPADVVSVFKLRRLSHGTHNPIALHPIALHPIARHSSRKIFVGSLSSNIFGLSISLSKRPSAGGFSSGAAVTLLVGSICAAWIGAALSLDPLTRPYIHSNPHADTQSQSQSNPNLNPNLNPNPNHQNQHPQEHHQNPQLESQSNSNPQSNVLPHSQSQIQSKSTEQQQKQQQQQQQRNPKKRDVSQDLRMKIDSLLN